MFAFLKRRKYDYYEFHEGMARAIGSGRECGYIDHDGKLVIRLTNEIGDIIFATTKDVNWEDETVKSYAQSVRGLHSLYYCGGSDFKNGVALVTWTILPDGRYFADDDGFGAEDNDEVNIYCYIDKRGKIIIPFQGMTEEDIQNFRKIAEIM